VTSQARELGFAALTAAIVVSGVVISRGLQALAFGAALAVACALWQWPRSEHIPRLRRRLGDTLVAGFAGLATGILGTIPAGAAGLAGVLALASLAVAIPASRRVRPAPAAFDGTLHARTQTTLPGTELAAAMWVVRQGRRRWSSSARVELRDEARRVMADPRDAQPIGDGWRPSGALRRSIARELDGAVPAQSIQVWLFREGGRAFVIGHSEREVDPDAPTLRDPERIDVFGGALVIGEGARADAAGAANLRIAAWTAVALAAGVVGLLGACR
jgi:hypothetical protein